jgi:hypothetical protein
VEQLEMIHLSSFPQTSGVAAGKEVEMAVKKGILLAALEWVCVVDLVS